MLAAIAAAFVLPACSADQATAGVGGELPALVTVKERPDGSISNLGRAPLQVDQNGCLRHGQAFVIWHTDSRILRTPDGRIQVIDGWTDKAVHVGEEVGMSGVDVDTPPDPARLAGPIPEACATGLFKMAGPVVTAAELQAMDERDANRKPIPLPPEAESTLVRPGQ